MCITKDSDGSDYYVSNQNQGRTINYDPVRLQLNIREIRGYENA